LSADLELRALPAGNDELIDVWDQLSSVEWIGDVEPNTPGHISWDTWRALQRKLDGFPSIEVGQVSWVKAGLTDLYDRYVPGPVARTVDLIGDGKILTPGLAKEITVAFNLPNRSIYGHVEYVKLTRKNCANIAMLEEFRRNSFPGQGKRNYYDPVWLAGDILRYPKGGGIAKGSVVKRFLQANMGCFLVQDSV